MSLSRIALSRRLLLLLALATSACLALQGCTSPDTSPGAGRGDTWPAPMNDPQISVLDPELREWIAFPPANITRDDARQDPRAGGGRDRITDVQIPVRNLTERVYKIEYRFLWFDADGRQVEPVMGWSDARLDPKQVVRLVGNASLVDARDYRLEVRWSR